jgi:hypothetical protein
LGIRELAGARTGRGIRPFVQAMVDTVTEDQPAGTTREVPKELADD